MTNKELKKLRREDLLELLLEQSKENEELRRQLDEANAKLESRAIVIDNAGSLAEAALQLNGVFEAAQKACTQYTENIRLMVTRQELVCARMEAETRESCKKMVEDAKKESQAYWDEVRAKAKEINNNEKEDH